MSIERRRAEGLELPGETLLFMQRLWDLVHALDQRSLDVRELVRLHVGTVEAAANAARATMTPTVAAATVLVRSSKVSREGCALRTGVRT